VGGGRGGGGGMGSWRGEVGPSIMRCQQVAGISTL
jgi:hypothetical protein